MNNIHLKLTIQSDNADIIEVYTHLACKEICDEKIYQVAMFTINTTLVAFAAEILYIDFPSDVMGLLERLPVSDIILDMQEKCISNVIGREFSNKELQAVTKLNNIIIDWYIKNNVSSSDSVLQHFKVIEPSEYLAACKELVTNANTGASNNEN